MLEIISRFSRRAVTGVAAVLGATITLSSFAQDVFAAVPVKVESENIVFYGDVDVKQAQERVRKWEVFRRMIYALSGVSNPPPDKNKLTIYGFADTEALQDFTDNPGIAGVYTQGVDGPIFLTSVNNKFTEGAFSEHVGLHEYTHHVLNSFVKQGFPRWYDEGFANYLMSMYIGDNSVVVGSPDIDFAKSVKSGRAKWLDPEVVLSANSMYPTYTRRQWRRGGATSFYAQGWLYVHYMRSTPEYSDKLPEYLRLLNTTGYDAIEAFEEAFDVSIEKFHREASRYFRKDSFVQTEYLPGPEIMDVKMTAKRLSEAELARMQVPARLAFLGDGNARDFRRDLMKAYEETPNDNKVQMGLVALDVQDEKYEDALMRAQGALASDRNNVDLLHTAGFAKFMSVAGPHWDDLKRGEFSPLPANADMDTAMDYYTKILMKNPTDFYALNYITQFYGQSEAEVTDFAFDAARILDIRYMQNFNPSWGMNIATVYAKRGFELDACSYYLQAKDATNQMRGRSNDYFEARYDWFVSNYGQNCDKYKPEEDES